MGLSCANVSIDTTQVFYANFTYDSMFLTMNTFFIDSSTTVKTTKKFDIESVIDPKTNEELSAKEAVERGIIDEATGELIMSRFFTQREW